MIVEAISVVPKYYVVPNNNEIKVEGSVPQSTTKNPRGLNKFLQEVKKSMGEPQTSRQVNPSSPKIY